ncbi:hypothetical protein DIT71_07825 [Marinobacter vulgaris]|uniref:Uncharacterized protein n=1 Tax=Marinobacter vulgaris TaxID=1928331 RepID=A0A2V3ZLS2_9GAMM|nr:hypothetical protein [Marinobacter vulgaris]PXX91762.1 hypothetical protein DIT71_07825 [Marinobacter vulgaris]TSJ70730.1 hypothetical protein FPC41_07545 [Marinobacter vulgaris]
MEHVNEISAVEPEDISFDAVEIAGLVVPLLFAIMAIVLVALAPDSTGVASKDPKTESQRVELVQQIQKR